MNLDAIDVLFMHYITGRTPDEVNKYDFWQLQYGRRPGNLLRRLMDAGVIYEDDSLPATLPKLRVFELKFILKQAGLKISGNKPELVKRILQHAGAIDFSAVPLKNVYVLSDGQADFYSATGFLNFFHFNGNFDLHEVYEFYLKSGGSDPHRTAVTFLEGKVRTHLHDRNKYTAIKAYFLLSNYALEEMQDMQSSIYYLNHFIMLIVLQATEGGGGDGSEPHFYIDAYTRSRYKSYMEAGGIDAVDLVQYLAGSTADLPYPGEARRKAAELIAAFIEAPDFY
ncbi:SAP domain-containing protein [Salinicoccus kekensis]|uniref:SAP domain-containing protein n=1 Tax=Salinicoccus kekensis TaxID=714307 RepID=A0A285UPK2_9STAP|nr:SAP domain-containing protein [Salinicoccus kekensis]SOC43835.1 SAP domain-containing protein [Salinicoccus kekensis]